MRTVKESGEPSDLTDLLPDGYRTSSLVTRPVIGFINNTGAAGDRTVAHAGRHVLGTNGFDLLVSVLRRANRLP